MTGQINAMYGAELAELAVIFLGLPSFCALAKVSFVRGSSQLQRDGAITY